MNPRNVLLEAFHAALAAVDARRCVRDALAAQSPAATWHIVAVGKAAGAMALGAVEALGPQVAGGLVVLPPGHLPAQLAPARHGLRILEASHPVPDERSVVAGEAVAQFVTGLPAAARLMFLVSGGASALLEWPRAGVTLEDIALLNRWALGAGLPIGALNALRRRLSRLKGGGLAALAAGRHCVALMVSDVPGDDPRVIGSGLLHAPPPGADDGLAVPAALRPALSRVEREAVRPLPVPRIPTRVVASLRLASLAAASRAEALGCRPVIGRSRLQGDAAEAGSALAVRARRLADRALLICGGETTVTLPAEAGRGGRSQHLALAAAIELATTPACGVTLLAAGTDGIDGATADAGALVDGGTCTRGRDAGLHPSVSLARADSGSFLEAAGDLLHTGPTLT
ncbi:MAG: glycerate kinase type-2 family protein, partial [Steroidobacteraceae bacterium]